MATLTLQGTLRNAFAEEFSNTIIQYASGSALFCDILLQIIDSDIHAVNLGTFLNSSVKWYSYSGHLEKHVIRTRFKEVFNDPKTKVLFKTIQD